MPPSQLKRLKSSLREQGITGPQKSKKQKKTAKSKQFSSNDRSQRTAALQQIRDSFNPFELRPASSRPAKFRYANTPTSTNGSKGGYKEVLHRPGVSKSAGEEMRRRTLLPEMQKRNKVGGLVDRRIGEGDAGLTAEERAMERFVKEKQRRKGGAVFDLEGSGDEDEPTVGLTHGGRSLDHLPADKVVGDGWEGSGSDSEDGEELLRRKRRRSDEDDDDGSDANGEAEPERKRSRKEIMEEVMAKSKFHRYERQKAKEDDEDLREELDKDTNNLLKLLRGHQPPPNPNREPLGNGNAEPAINPDRQRLLDGTDRAKMDQEYDARLKQLAQDARAKPSVRTKTEEEKVQEEAEKLRQLEQSRQRRMKGGQDSEDGGEGVAKVDADADVVLGGDEEVLDEAAEFGFANTNARSERKDVLIVLDDEDDFALDEDLIASGSDVDASENSASDDESDEEADPAIREEEEEDEFVKGILGNDIKTLAKANGEVTKPFDMTNLAFTYPCPRSHTQLLDVLQNTEVSQLPTIIQRIRALHHPSLNATNKEAMADFSMTLVQHLSYMGTTKQPLAMTEQVIRHLHSLSRTYPVVIAGAFRTQLQAAQERNNFHAGDLVILTAIGSIYPTSDHFHPVVTPAITLMARWLSISTPYTAPKHAIGSFVVALCIRYQRLSRRYVPEAMRFTLRALAAKATSTEEETTKAHSENLMAMADLWKDKTAFLEIFHPAIPILQNLGAATKRELQTLQILLSQSSTHRRPLELHNHRPLAIRTSIPKFEEGFNPEKHYDPDKERSDARKLQQEYRREKKGAVRELRKDANFVAREQLAEKRTRDAEYEKNYRRLVAEIQGGEGHEGRVYEGEKRRRKAGKGKGKGGR